MPIMKDTRQQDLDLDETLQNTLRRKAKPSSVTGLAESTATLLLELCHQFMSECEPGPLERARLLSRTALVKSQMGLPSGSDADQASLEKFTDAIRRDSEGQ